MTVKEAIEILKKKIVPCVKHSAWEEAVYMAISALEKQVGGKPFPDDDTSILACPYCGAKMDGGVEEEE